MPVHPQVSCRPLMFEFTMAEPFPFESMRLFAPVSSAPDLDTKIAQLAKEGTTVGEVIRLLGEPEQIGRAIELLKSGA